MASHNLKNMIRAVQTDLPITMRMEKWLTENPSPVYSDLAVQHVNDFLTGKVGGNRANRKPHFRASGGGKCQRQRVLTRIGTQGLPQRFTSAQANIFSTGNMMHLKWQLAGLTEGWLNKAEVAFDREDIDLAGTADGVVHDGSLLEYKTINDNGFQWVLSRGIREDHLRQIAGYKLLHPEFEAASVIYENKNNGEWRELRVVFTNKMVEEAQQDLEFLRNSVKAEELPPIKPLCALREGAEYNQCPFRDNCLGIKGWPT